MNGTVNNDNDVEDRKLITFTVLICAFWEKIVAI